MNHVTLIGRLTKDPVIRYTQSNTAVANYTLAVDRPFTKEGEEKQADFINCVAWGKTAEFAQKYLHKGTKIAIEGRIQTGSYDDKNGNKVYTTDVIVERHEFCEKRSSSDSAPYSVGEFVEASADDDDLPF